MKKRTLIGLVMAVVLVSAWSLGASAYIAAVQPSGEITSPEDGELVFGLTDFEAVYFDDDPGGVQWAVRYETCAAATNTVFGNVDYWNWKGGFWDWPVTNHLTKPEACWPNPYDWPLTEAYFDIFLFVSMDEFTVDTWAPNVFVWGYLAARGPVAPDG